MSVAELYSTLVNELGIAPQYVLDEMQTYEIVALMENRHLRHKESWEQSRLIAYIIAQCNSKKQMKVTDIIKFSWDNENDKAEQQMTKEKYQRMMARAKAIQNELNNTENTDI